MITIKENLFFHLLFIVLSYIFITYCNRWKIPQWLIWKSLIFNSISIFSASSVVSVRSRSLTINRQIPTIFKEKALSLPMTKPENKKQIQYQSLISMMSRMMRWPIEQPLHFVRFFPSMIQILLPKKEVNCRVIATIKYFVCCTPPLSSFSKRRIMVGCVIDVMIKVIMMMMINILQEKWTNVNEKRQIIRVKSGSQWKLISSIFLCHV